VGTVEDAHSVIKTNKFVVFGGAGCLNKEIAHGKVMVPTDAYRDEGTSYHYAPAADYVTVNHADEVASFMKDVDERPHMIRGNHVILKRYDICGCSSRCFISISLKGLPPFGPFYIIRGKENFVFKIISSICD